MTIKTTLFTTFSVFLFSFYANSQSIYIPRNVKAAYENGTRSKDGNPGKHYWQNHGKYDIQITALPPDRTIKGKETITYYNESPDTLKQIVLRLWLNFHKPQSPHLGYMSLKRLNDGIQLNKIKVNNQPYAVSDLSGSFTAKAIKLNTPLQPNDSIQLSIDWQYEISLTSGREGMIDSTTYYLAYFFPRVTVYDDYNGWDRLDFTGYQEFYNDFNDYTFSVTVPKNYLVWATGKFLNPEEVLQPKYLQRLEKSYASDQVIHIATKADLRNKEITKRTPTSTWKWKADNVTALAIAISNHYNWDASSIVINDKTGKRVNMQAAYNDTARDFHQMVDFGKQALHWFSNNLPGIPYPYPKMTAIQGFADMEYPMMINDATTDDPAFSQFVANHEIAHTYFPFFMGTNESRYAFMDEGWATTFEYLIGIHQIGKKKADQWYKDFRVKKWINDPSQEEQIPIITPSNQLRNMAYGSNAYVKPSLGYLALKDMLGDKVFKKCLQGYMYRWHGKHPNPWDFFFSFNDLSGKNLNWFWKSWYFSHGYIDLKLSKIRKEGRKYTVSIQNIGGLPNPFNLLITYQDGTTKRKHFTSKIWKKNLRLTLIELKSKKEMSSLKIETGIWMDANPEDNLKKL
ncbi:MAG TPA: M1 family metallopeptidase [Chitinophagaceae bacterium]|nr:M1 family metallopeptidase [Chitinophagaceae bacterium]